MIKNIVLDMGNVIMRWDPDYIASKLASNEEEKQIIKNELFNSKAWQLLDEGLIDNEQAIELIGKHQNIIKYALEHWYDYFEELTNIVPLIKELKALGYKIYLLSNCSMHFYNYYKNVEAFKYFDDFYISASHKLLKPDITIYQDFLSNYNLLANECIFVDDVEVNVVKAREIGIDGYLYDGDVFKLKSYIFDIIE